jgi:hypothetical protein
MALDFVTACLVISHQNTQNTQAMPTKKPERVLMYVKVAYLIVQVVGNL